MSTATIATISEALRKRLNAALGANRAELADPTKAGDNAVSLWLYQITVDEFARNDAPARAEAANGRGVAFRFPPLAVNLFYLVTPMSAEQDAAQNDLAAVMLALHEEPELAVSGVGVSDVVRVSFVTDGFDERVRLWEALSRPYRLSVCYQVRTARLATKVVAADAPVGSTRFDRERTPQVASD